jgi:magnesium chelatase family protein
MNIFSYYQNGFKGEALSIQVSSFGSNLSILGMGAFQNRQFKEKALNIFSCLGQGKPSGLVQVSKKVPLDEIELAILLALLLEKNQLSSTSQTDILVMGRINLDGTLTGSHSLLDAPKVAENLGCRLLVAPDAIQTTDLAFLAIETPSTLRQALTLTCRFLIKNQGAITPQSSVPLLPTENPYTEDPFFGIIGMETTRKAMALCAAGHLNILLFGPPGSGKSLMLHRLSYLLPNLSKNERIETELLRKTDSDEIPFVEIRPDMGEKDVVKGKPPLVSFAHNGILCLDELPNQKPKVLLSVRSLLDGKECKGFPCNFLLASAMNACPCGNLGLPQGICRCNEKQIANYWKKVGSPLLDRFDLIVPVKTENLLLSNVAPSSENLLQTIGKVREQFLKRDEEEYKKLLPLFNRCNLSNSMSLRSAISICRTATLIANFNGKDIAGKEDMNEALSYKAYGLDKPYWYPR